MDSSAHRSELSSKKHKSDEREARRRLDDLPRGSLKTARAATIVAIIAALGVLVTIVVMMVLGDKGARDDSLGRTVIGICVAIAVPALLVFAAAKDRSERLAVSVLDGWIAENDPGRRARGLPPSLRPVALMVAGRMLRIGSVVAYLAGFLAVLSGGALIASGGLDGIPTAVPIAIIVVGIGLIVVATLAWRRLRRRQITVGMHLAPLLGDVEP